MSHHSPCSLALRALTAIHPNVETWIVLLILATGVISSTLGIHVYLYWTVLDLLLISPEF